MKLADLYKGMLVLDGHIVRPGDLDPGAADPAPEPARRHPAPLWPRLRDAFLVLGGRPMHAGHDLDIEEPFELSR